MKRCVIVGGAEIRERSFVRSCLSPEDFYIVCDSGLKHREALKIRPDLIVGDFDSHENPHLPVETIVLPRRKDDTDTMFAVKEALRRGFTDFLLIGVIGARFDHSFANVSILLYLSSRGARGRIIDDYSEMEMVSESGAEIPDRYPYFSLLAMDGPAKGVTIRDALFPLEDAVIGCEYQYGVSNEVLPGKKARVTVKEGRLLLIKDRPEREKSNVKSMVVLIPQRKE